MSQTITLHLEDLPSKVAQIAERLVSERLDQILQPDQQFNTQQVAEILALDASTVHSYFRLPIGHVRRLPFVECSDSGRGRRVRLSDLKAWQERNLSDTLEQTKKQEFDSQVAAIGARRSTRRARRGGLQ